MAIDARLEFCFGAVVVNMSAWEALKPKAMVPKDLNPKP